MSDPAPTPLLRVAGLKTEYQTSTGPVLAVDGVSFDIFPGQVVGLVGESGCGKTATVLSILRLLNEHGRILGGSVELGGTRLLELPERSMEEVRGRRVAMIFQEPMTALNPVLTVGHQIAEGLRWQGRVGRREAREWSIELLRLVGIPSPGERVDDYPHRMSSGMRQRVLLAIALACEPDLLIADEPTSALDVTVQAQILALLGRLQVERQLSVLLITHDFGVVAETCDRVVVMYAGRIVEQATAVELFRHPHHPYTAGLLRSIPALGGVSGGQVRLPFIRGQLKRSAAATGCRFRDRCDHAEEDCTTGEPLLSSTGDGHAAACFHPL